MDPYQQFNSEVRNILTEHDRTPTINVACLVGAGLSAGSGLETFRGTNGMYINKDPMKLASRRGFEEDPLTVWTWYRDRIAKVLTTQPNPGHLALVELEKMGILHYIVTQNVDGLHLQAGQSPDKILEIHGTLSRTHCFNLCGREYILEQIPESVPVQCACGSYQRPSVVFFGEGLLYDFFEIIEEIRSEVDILLLIGTSGTVYPVAQIPNAVSQNTLIVNINPDISTFQDIADISIAEKAEVALPKLIANLKTILKQS